YPCLWWHPTQNHLLQLASLLKKALPLYWKCHPHLPKQKYSRSIGLAGGIISGYMSCFHNMQNPNPNDFQGNSSPLQPQKNLSSQALRMGFLFPSYFRCPQFHPKTLSMATNKYWSHKEKHLYLPLPKKL